MSDLSRERVVERIRNAIAMNDEPDDLAETVYRAIQPLLSNVLWWRDQARRERDQALDRIAKVREIAEAASKPCAYDQTAVCTHEENAINPAELLAVLDGEGEKATGGIVTESIVVGESGCSLPHMPLPKGGIPTGQKVTVHVSDPALREVIDKALDLRDCTEDAAYDNAKIADEKSTEYREPDCWIDDDGQMQCNKCKDQVLAFKDGGWACKCDSAMFEHAKPSDELGQNGGEVSRLSRSIPEPASNNPQENANG